MRSPSFRAKPAKLQNDLQFPPLVACVEKLTRTVVKMA
jgi:hypothetical protein